MTNLRIILGTVFLNPDNLGLVAAALGHGIVAGPGVGGALAHVGLAAPFLAAAALNRLNFAAALVLLPEFLGAGSRWCIELARWSPRVSLRPLFRASALARLFWCYLLLPVAGRTALSMFAQGIRGPQNTSRGSPWTRLDG